MTESGLRPTPCNRCARPSAPCTIVLDDIRHDLCASVAGHIDRLAAQLRLVQDFASELADQVEAMGSVVEAAEAWRAAESGHYNPNANEDERLIQAVDAWRKRGAVQA